MLVIGLTGATGSGKGAVGGLFAELGIPSLDTDAVYHRLVSAPSPCLDALAEEFGSSVIAADGSLDRRALATVVFCGGEEQERRNRRLQSITHPYVLGVCRLWLAEQKRMGKAAAIIDAPLLYESGFDRECDRVIAVTASTQLRLSRIMLRDGLDIERAQARIGAQPSNDFYTARADLVIENEGDLGALKRQVRAAYEALLA